MLVDNLANKVTHRLEKKGVRFFVDSNQEPCVYIPDVLPAPVLLVTSERFRDLLNDTLVEFVRFNQFPNCEEVNLLLAVIFDNCMDSNEPQYKTGFADTSNEAIVQAAKHILGPEWKFECSFEEFQQKVLALQKGCQISKQPEISTNFHIFLDQLRAWRPLVRLNEIEIFLNPRRQIDRQCTLRRMFDDFE